MASLLFQKSQNIGLRVLLLIPLAWLGCVTAAWAADLSPDHEWCVQRAAVQYYRLGDPLSFQGFVDLIHAVFGVENSCGISHVNDNGSIDVGCMQINSSNWRTLIRYGISPEALRFNDCQNIMVGTWLLHENLAAGPDLWTAIGNYNSHTPKYNRIYQLKVWKKLQRLWADRLARR